MLVIRTRSNTVPISIACLHNGWSMTLKRKASHDFRCPARVTTGLVDERLCFVGGINWPVEDGPNITYHGIVKNKSVVEHEVVVLLQSI